MRFSTLFLVAILSLGAAPAPDQHDRDVELLRSYIIQSGEAFNAGDPDAVMKRYARDVVLSYPGIPDMGYEALVQGYREMLKRKPGDTAKTTPTIEEILVSGDLAVIRVMWTTTTSQANPPRQETRQMKDLQVWRRESDGSWRFARGMHFRMTPPEPPKPPAR
jgi:uncharacterized protein (TIGR02246 family)